MNSTRFVACTSACDFSRDFSTKSDAIVYGCSIAGQWKCVPSPTKCYREATYLAVQKYSNYKVCQARTRARK